jgi:hypothetical protein
MTQQGESRVILAFEGDPRGGFYMQRTFRKDQVVREFGHWAATPDGINMLMMATDIRQNPHFGTSLPYEIQYFGPDKIRISGPARPDVTYERAPKDTVVDFNS